MQNALRFATVFVLVLCVAGIGLAQKQGKEKTSAGPVIVNPAPNEINAGVEIFKEGFNDTTIAWFLNSGWTMINNDHGVSTTLADPSDTCWYQSFVVGGDVGLPMFEGIACAAAYWGTSNGYLLDDWLVTPNTGSSAPAGSVDSLTFWTVSRLSSSGSYADSLDVRVSTTDKAVGSFTRLVYMNVPKSAWTRVALLLPQGTTRYVAFRYLLYDGGEDGSNSDKICVDDVRITRYSSTAVGDQATGIPSAYALHQNYPNPFNPSTQIAFSLPKAGWVTLQVYDALGREISTLVDEELSAGLHTRSFNATGLAGGVYFCRLTAGDYSAARLMIMAK